LIDFELAAPVLTGMLLLAAGYAVVSVRGGHRSGALAALTLGLGVGGVLSLVVAIASVIAHRTAADTWSCWTF
jgi:hypothetical protein